ncbi:hypothetical protein [Pseudoroseicyclus sp. CXY001]|uniref:acyltransferase n=1 Tax=Pseudoroseicyclus sp. CXY001 TaxID=3242492 RepID=UPI003570BC9C
MALLTGRAKARREPDAVLEAFRAWLPDSVTIAEPSGARVVALDGAKLPGLTLKGSFGPGAHLILWGGFQPSAEVPVTIRARRSVPDDLMIGIGPVESGAVTINVVGQGGRLAVGASRKMHLTCNLLHDSEVVFGDDTTTERAAVTCRHGHVRLGRDCMLSSDVEIDAAQHHGLVDLSGDTPRLDDRPSGVTVGDHVWLGKTSMLIGRASVGSGSIIGAGSVFAGAAPANTALAGNPAKVLRESVTWSRKYDAIDPATLGYISTLQGTGPASAAAGFEETAQ